MIYWKDGSRYVLKGRIKICIERTDHDILKGRIMIYWKDESGSSHTFMSMLLLYPDFSLYFDLSKQKIYGFWSNWQIRGQWKQFLAINLVSYYCLLMWLYFLLKNYNFTILKYMILRTWTLWQIKYALCIAASLSISGGDPFPPSSTFRLAEFNKGIESLPQTLIFNFYFSATQCTVLDISNYEFCLN